MKDIHAGLGGSYLINSAGEKVLVHRTGHVAPEVSETAVMPMPDAPKSKKAKNMVVAEEQPSTESKPEGDKL